METPSVIFKRWVFPLLLAILAMALGWQLRQVPPTQSIASIGPLTDLTTITIVCDGHTMNLDQGETGWHDRQHPDWELDQDGIKNWINQFSAITFTKVNSSSPAAEFGLNRPVMSIQCKSMSGRETHLDVGRISPSGRVYISLNSSIFTARHDQVAGIWIKDDSFRNRRPFNDLLLTSVQSIRVRGDMRRLGGVLENIEIKKGSATGFWYLVSTRNSIVDTDRVSKLIALVQTMTISRFIDEPPGIPLHIDIDGPSAVHILMKLTSDDTAAIFLGGHQWGVIYPVWIQGLSDIIRHPIGENPLTFDRFFFTACKITTSQNTVILKKNNVGHWIDQRGQVGTVSLHNVFVTLQSLRPTGDSHEKGDVITIAVTSGNATEVFDIAYINQSTIRASFKAPRGTLMLGGDASELRSQIIKLTALR